MQRKDAPAHWSQLTFTLSMLLKSYTLHHVDIGLKPDQSLALLDQEWIITWHAMPKSR